MSDKKNTKKQKINTKNEKGWKRITVKTPSECQRCDTMILPIYKGGAYMKNFKHKRVFTSWGDKGYSTEIVCEKCARLNGFLD